jgi:TPP-dependent pyruvate/acetoin dehydrogenase alpha subunit
MKKIKCDGNDVMDVHRGSEEAMNYARKMGRPVLLLVEKLNRRFGHGKRDNI